MLGLNKLGGLAKRLAPVAPFAAAVLSAHPATAVAGAVLNRIAGVTGSNPDEESVSKSIDNLDMATLQRLAEADAQIKAELEAAHIDLSKAQLADVQDARRSHGSGGYMQLLGSVVVVAFVGISCLMLWHVIDSGEELSDSADKLIYVVFASLSTLAAQVISFWYGSSHGSRAKDGKP